jgi:Ser/Thr protein kinase RdoA (MazF antagonist)
VVEQAGHDGSSTERCPNTVESSVPDRQPAGERYAMRVSDPDEHPPPHTMTEVEWLLQLGRETDLNLVQPVPRLDGKYLTPLVDGSGTFINYVARASDDPEPFLTKATARLERYLAAG